MQACVAVAFALSLIAAPGDDTAARVTEADFHGSWVGFSSIRGGMPVAADEAAQTTFIFAGDKLTTINSGRQGASRSFKIDAKADPMTITLTTLDGPDAGRQYTVIFRLRDDILTICGDQLGPPVPKEFASPKGSRIVLHSFRRAN